MWEAEGERVHILCLGRTHSSSDSVVYFESRKLLVAGDTVFAKWHPPFADPNTDVTAWIEALDRLLVAYDIELLVPGHGKVAEKKAISEMRNYLSSIAEAVGDEARLGVLKEKYKDYLSIPFMAGFDKTVQHLRSRQ